MSAIASQGWVKDLFKKVINNLNAKYCSADKPDIYREEILYVNKRPIELQSSITFYVNGNTGNNATGDGTQTKPLKSLSRVREMLPQNINDYRVTIYVEGNLSGLGTQYFGSFTCGEIFLKMVNNPVFYNINFYRIQHLIIQGDFTINYTNTEATDYGFGLQVYDSQIWYEPGTVGLTINGVKNYHTRGIYVALGSVFSTAYATTNIITIKNCVQPVVAEFYGHFFVGKLVGSGNSEASQAGCGGRISYTQISGMSTGTYAGGRIN